MDLMNRVYRPMFDRFLIVLIDDILIYLKTREKHQVHLREVLDSGYAEEVEALCKFSKCEFLFCEVQFFGHIVNQKGILVDSTKIKAIVQWEVPRTTSEIQSFFACDSFDKE